MAEDDYRGRSGAASYSARKSYSSPSASSGSRSSPAHPQNRGNQNYNQGPSEAEKKEKVHTKLI